MAKTDPINVANPAGSSDPKQGDDHIRTLARAVAEILGVDHYIGSSSPYSEDAAGEHKKVTLNAVLGADPDPGTGKGSLYIKTANAKPELFYEDADDNVIQLTSGGTILTASLEGYPGKVVQPTGVIIAFGGSSAPTGWVLCDGTAYSRTVTYDALFAVIGTAYGVGDGSTTFNVPDLRGRVPVGLDAGNVNLAAADALGESGGEETHTLSSDEMPSHKHSIDVVEFGGGGGGSEIGNLSDGGAHGDDDTKTTGGGSAHNNLQPYMTVNFIIKT